MINALLITDANGFPLYDKNITQLKHFEPSLLSGLISSISHIGQSIFHENIGTVQFGNEVDPAFICIITKEIPQTKQVVHFVFFMQGRCDMVYIKKIAAGIFIEIKRNLQAKAGSLFEIPSFQSKVDQIIEHRFYNFRAC